MTFLSSVEVSPIMLTMFDKYYKHFVLKVFLLIKKCAFAQDTVNFLGFIVSYWGVSVDPEKVRIVAEWPTPNNVHEVCSFHRLASFYKQFVLGFSAVMAPITKCTKKGLFIWTTAAQQAFCTIKKLLTEAPVLRLSNFEAPFEVSCDVSHSDVGGVLSQGGHPIAYFSEKLNEAHK
jgi:hypothetical protein